LKSRPSTGGEHRLHSEKQNCRLINQSTYTIRHLGNNDPRSYVTSSSEGQTVAPSTASSYRTPPQLAAELSAPLWLIRRLADRLDRGRCLRVGQGLRLIPADLARDIEAELRRHKARRSSDRETVDA